MLKSYDKSHLRPTYGLEYRQMMGTAVHGNEITDSDEMTGANLSWKSLEDSCGWLAFY